MMLAASFAGIGFGSAGVHLPHAMAYPVRWGSEALLRARDTQPNHALVPHGFSVILNAPAVFPLHSVGKSRASPRRCRGTRSGCVAN
jgi:alcohol dehydrogenase class IV